MKIQSLHSLAALGLFGAGLTTAAWTPLAGPQDVDLAAQLQRVEASLTTLQAQHAELTEELSNLADFVAGSAGRADALLSSLTRAESLGFTAGMNFESREELLAGFRTYLNDTKKSLKSLGGDKSEKADGGRPPRR